MKIEQTKPVVATEWIDATIEASIEPDAQMLTKLKKKLSEMTPDPSPFEVNYKPYTEAMEELNVRMKQYYFIPLMPQ